MVISNAERQALHRQRLKAKLSLMDELVIRTRSDIREWKRMVALLQSGFLRVGWDNNDGSEAQVISLQRMISENQILVDQYDPDGSLADGDFEFGDVPADLARSLWKGQPVAYLLDDQGRACNISTYPDVDEARVGAKSSNRLPGIIGEQGWSVTPLTP